MSEENSAKNYFLHSYFGQVSEEIPEQLYSKRVLLYLVNEMPSGVSWQHTHSKLIGNFAIFTVATFL